MPEASPGLEALFGQSFGQTFALSFEGTDTSPWERGELVSILEKSGRDRWFYRNLNKHLKGRTGGVWYQVVTKWIGDIDSATETMVSERRISRTGSENEQIDTLRRQTIAAMAVASSARAMELSAGGMSDYVTQLSGRGDAGIQDTLDHLILHNHPERLNEVLQIDGVSGYFNQITSEAGISNYTPWVTDEKPAPSQVSIREDSLRLLAGNGSELIRILSDPGRKSEAYITHLIEGKHGDPITEYVKAKLAFDVFLVDVFTRWQYQQQRMIDQLLEESEGLKEDDTQKTFNLELAKAAQDKLNSVKPVENWGGDPLRVVEEPTFLPRRIKGVFKGRGKVILDLFDQAFCPRDMFKRWNIAPLVPSMVTHLKRLDRYSSSVAKIFKTTTALGFADFSADGLKALSEAVDLLFQVYGDAERVISEMPKVNERMGGELVGLMISRIIEAKALAAVSATASPNLSEILGIIFEEEGGREKSPRPFLDARKALWGQSLQGRSGLLTEWASTQYGLRFNPNTNRMGAWKHLTEAWELMATNAQTREQRERMVTVRRLSIIMDGIEAINEAFFKGRS